MSYSPREKSFKRHPCVVAQDAWLDSGVGSECAKPAAFLTKPFLTNRLKRAFTAGWFAAESGLKSEIQTLKESRAVAIEREQQIRAECNQLRAERREV